MIAIVVDEFGVIDECHRHIVALQLDRASKNDLKSFISVTLNPDLGQSVTLLQLQRPVEDRGASCRHHDVVRVVSEDKLLDLGPRDVISTAELAIDVLEGVVTEFVGRSNLHFEVVEHERKHALVLRLREFVILPGENGGRILALVILHRLVDLVTRQNTVVAEVVVLNQGDSAVYVEEGAVGADELVASDFVALQSQSRIQEVTVEIENARGVLQRAIRDHLHVHVVCYCVVAHQRLNGLLAVGNGDSELRRVDVEGIVHAHDHGLGILEVVLGEVAPDIEGK